MSDSTDHDDDPLLNNDEFAALIGWSASTLRAYRTDGRLIEPDGTKDGRLAWRRSRCLDWKAGLPGRGRWSRNPTAGRPDPAANP